MSAPAPGDEGAIDAQNPDAFTSPIAENADGSATPQCRLDEPFGSPTLVTGLGVAGSTAAGLRLSANGLTAYFYAAAALGSSSELFTATRSTPAMTFSSISPLMGDGINTSDNESDPTVRGDGLLLVFGRSTGASALVHLYYATRATVSSPFESLGLVPNVNDSVTVDQQPFLREDGQILYFASSRVQANFADVYRAAWNGSSFDAPSIVSELDTQYNDYFPVVTGDDKTIYFASGRPDANAVGGDDIWMATRDDVNLPFSTPSNVTELNSTDADTPTFVTADGCTLYFSSTRDRSQIQMYVASRPSL